MNVWETMVHSCSEAQAVQDAFASNTSAISGSGAQPHPPTHAIEPPRSQLMNLTTIHTLHAPCDPTENVAYGKAVSCSSNSTQPHLGNDGVIGGGFIMSDPGNFTDQSPCCSCDVGTSPTSSASLPSPWFQIDLGLTTPVARVILYNRESRSFDRHLMIIGAMLMAHARDVRRNRDSNAGAWTCILTRRPDVTPQATLPLRRQGVCL